MINLKSYVVMKEELDGDNIQWKFDNWSKGIESSSLDAFMKEAPNQKDIEAFKKLVDNSGINFNALTDMMNDDAKGLPDNYDNIYILKKIIDTINTLNKGKINHCFLPVFLNQSYNCSAKSTFFILNATFIVS